MTAARHAAFRLPSLPFLRHAPLPLALLLLAAPAAAHTGHGESFAFMDGLAHPPGGLDHLLAMVVVGAWAGLAGGSRRWLWPAAFVGSMVVGSGLGLAGLALPGLELLIALSVALLGGLMAWRRPALEAWAALAIAAAGFVHGFAHGAEAPVDGNGLAYVAGFVLSTAALHAVGLAVALVARPAAAQLALRAGGGLAAALGVLMVVGVL